MHTPPGFDYAVVWPSQPTLDAELEIEKWLDTHVGEYETHWIYSRCCVCFVNADHALEFALRWS